MRPDGGVHWLKILDKVEKIAAAIAAGEELSLARIA